MLGNECRSDQQLDADEEKEQGSFVLPGRLRDGKPVRGEQKTKRRAQEQEDSHAGCLIVPEISQTVCL